MRISYCRYYRCGNLPEGKPKTLWENRKAMTTLGICSCARGYSDKYFLADEAENPYGRAHPKEKVPGSVSRNRLVRTPLRPKQLTPRY